MCDDVEVASILIGAGVAVVLCGADADRLAGAVQALRHAGGRVGALVGDPGCASVEAVALTMAAELFGGEPVMVRTVSHARQLAAGSGTVDSPTLP